MIFRALGWLICRAWFVLLAAWAALVVGTWVAAPSWGQVAQDREFAFLPANAPSRVAEQVYAEAFPDDRLASSIVLVLHRTGQEADDLGRVRTFITKQLWRNLKKIAKAEGGLADEPPPSDEPLFSDEPAPAKPKQTPIIARIRTPNDPAGGALLVSPDGRVLLVVVELTTEFLSTRNWPILAKVEGLVHDLRRQGKIPPGLEIAVTGSAAIGRDHTLAALQSARATGRLTIILVIGLLVLIYRAPLLALIPLATVYLAVQVSLNLLAILGQAGYLTLFQGIQIYITILAYGAGVDYCLFLTARYKEALDRGASPAEAATASVCGVGAALAASAATVMCGIGMMYFAQFGKFREAGLAIPLSLAVVLLATLTFSPALLRLAGRWAFWPQRPGPGAGERSEGGFFQSGELRRIWDRVGSLLLRRAGTVWLLTVAVMAPFAIAAGLLYNRLSYDLIGDLPANAPSMAGTRLLQEHFPAGVMGPVTVLLVDHHVDFSGPQGAALVNKLTEHLAAKKDELGLADVRSLTAPLGVTAAAKAQPLKDLDLPKDVVEEAARKGALRRYVTSLGGGDHPGTRLALVLKQSPFAHQSIEELGRIKRAVWSALPDGMRGRARLYFAGTTASVHDLAVVMQQDRTRIEWLVLASVFVILLVLLRRLVVTVYLLLSVLFSYYVTLGVSFAVFWLLDPHGFNGIDWKVAIFLFTILIAVGEDYNIFLMTRVDEESRRYGPVRGVTEALERTGPIISSCGIIMAGTFAALLAAPLTDMKQMGFALAFGVLLDTFVVRPVLVPAFLILLRSGRLPFSRWVRKGPAAEPEPEHTHHSASSS